ncbi:MAG: polysaccharide biosynthesis protein [Ignavibacteriales bacterium]|jgi:O-antigen/teichoic acid export membrane protein|nr:MAG: polysaccharide biosynthesis protein [Ignavibacteriales bacterium]
MSYLKSKFTDILGLITKGHERSIKAKKNILASFIIKGLSIAISLVLVPLTINYVNPSRYGIWLTLSSMVSWFSFFDIGFGNGLRNRFAEALAKGQDELARIYVSTTYAILSIIIGIVLILFLIINRYLDWSKILNTTPEMAGELSILAGIVFVFFCLRFIFQLLATVLTANQEPAKASFFDFLGSFFSLIIIFILTKTTSGNLIYLGTALSFAPVFVLVFFSIWFYSRDYKRYAPSFKYVKLGFARNLMSLGIKFFIIQIAALVLFNTNNIIITQLLGPEEVTTFNVSFKLFSVVTMIFFIIATPLWSAFTDAYVKSDFEWIKSVLSKMRKIWYLLIIFSIMILSASPLIYKLWVGDSVKVPFALSVAMCIYGIVYIWQTIHVFLLNGIGKIKLQLYLVIFTGLINIPLAIFLGKKIGLVGISLTSILLFIFMGIFFSIQTQKILNKTAVNIWNK